jgi:hypothetical protein
MKTKSLYYGFGFLSFLITFIVYAMTVQPNVPFWDCGEFSSAATWQQVPHPPGAPLFTIAGKIFQIIIPFGDLGWRVNMLSVTATAMTIFLLYLIIVKIIQNYRNSPVENLQDALMVFGSAFVGAMSFAFSDTLWFNGVESEVYASSSVFVALVVYVMMRWNEEADNPGHEKYLLLLAYLLGLSIGVHLLAILATFCIVLMVYFRKYELSVKSFAITSVIGLVIFYLLYQVIMMWFPTMLAGNLPFKNAAREPLLEGSIAVTLFAIAIIILAIVGAIHGYRNNKPIIAMSSIAFIFILFGFTTYTQVLIRANSPSPMNENEPKTMRKLTSYLGREQYGDQRMWPRRTDYNDDLKISYYNQQDENGEYVYGEWNQPDSREVERKDGRKMLLPDYSNVNTSGELNYLMKYQINHMFLRYYFWNFVGRSSDVQDAGWTFASNTEAKILNYKSGFSELFPAKFYALPLLLGLFGLFFHFYKDPKMAINFLLMFLLMGVLAAIAQNQQNPQPRERDYFYTGAFMVHCIWIGLGVYGLIEMPFKKKINTGIVVGMLALTALIVPVNMAVGGWKFHSRAGNYIPFDYSYNILQSVEKDAILFTNGDNDTFPLWYLQDVEGVRRDVRIVNLSLGQTLWYIDHLKNRSPWGAKKIPLSFKDEQLRTDEESTDALKYYMGVAQNISIPVDKKILEQYTDDQEYIKSTDGNMKFTFVGSPYNAEGGQQRYIFYVSHQLILDILRQTKFERPVYFSSTVGSDVYVGLNRFLRLEGMAWKICPVPVAQTRTGNVNAEVMEQCLMNVDNSDNFSKEFKYGFKFRNLNNSGVYYDEVHRRLMANYRQIYMQYAMYMLDKKQNKEKSAQILDKMNEMISVEQFPLFAEEEAQMARFYYESNAIPQAKRFAQLCVNSANDLEKNPALKGSRFEREFGDGRGGRSNIIKAAAESYRILGDYESSRNLVLKAYDQLASQLSQIAQSGSTNPQAKRTIDVLRNNILETLSLMREIDDSQINDLQKSGNKAKALELANSLIDKYTKLKDPIIDQMYLPEIKMWPDKINGKIMATDSIIKVR